MKIFTLMATYNPSHMLPQLSLFYPKQFNCFIPPKNLHLRQKNLNSESFKKCFHFCPCPCSSSSTSSVRCTLSYPAPAHLDIIEGVGDAILGDGFHGSEGVSPWSDLDALYSGDEGQLPVDARVGHLGGRRQ